MSNAQTSPISGHPTPADVLAVHAEPLVRGRRVALLGVADDGLIERLLELGARVLYVYDPQLAVEPMRARGDARVTIAPLRAGDLGVREGAFDVALIPDLALLGEAEAALTQLRRLIGVAGVGLVGCRNEAAPRAWLESGESPPPPSYDELYDLCSLQFAEVRMLGVAPFAGYAVAEFAPEREPGIAFDASLAGAEAPEWFVAVVAQRVSAELEPYAVVQVPCDAIVRGAASGGDVASLRDQLSATAQKLHEAEARAGDQYVRAERLANDLRSGGEETRKLREKLARLGKELEDERKPRAPTESPEQRELISALQRDLIEARTQLATPRASDDASRVTMERDRLAAEVGLARERATLAEKELVAADQGLKQRNAAIEELRRRLLERERELEASLARGAQLEDRLAVQLAESSRMGDEAVTSAQLREHSARTEAIAHRLQAELQALQATHQEDVASLEAALRARGDELRAARVELQRRERLVRELVSQLEDAQRGVVVVAPIARVSDEDVAPLRQQLELARRELAAMLEEGRRRESALAEAKSARVALATELEGTRVKNEQLARDAARREAALQTASWRITELEKLGTNSADEPGADAGAAPRAANDAPGDSVELPRLRAELDALRRALSLEHERCGQLELQLQTAASAGEAGELSRVLSRLSERDTLIAQLSAELAARRGGS